MLTAGIIKEIKLSISGLFGHHVSRLPSLLDDMMTDNRQISYKQALRLLFVLYVIDYLYGAYDAKGIYRWFMRKRIQLGSRSPAQILTGDWNPNGKAEQKVMELARSLSQ